MQVSVDRGMKVRLIRRKRKKSEEVPGDQQCLWF